MVFDDIDLSIGHVGNASMSPNYKFTNSCSFCPTALTAACQCQPSQTSVQRVPRRLRHRLPSPTLTSARTEGSRPLGAVITRAASEGYYEIPQFQIFVSHASPLLERGR